MGFFSWLSSCLTCHFSIVSSEEAPSSFKTVKFGVSSTQPLDGILFLCLHFLSQSCMLVTCKFITPAQSIHWTPVCLSDITTGMLNRYLRLNMSKIELLIFPSKPYLPICTCILTKAMSFSDLFESKISKPYLTSLFHIFTLYLCKSCELQLQSLYPITFHYLYH